MSVLWKMLAWPAWSNLTLTLLHTLWQGAALAGLLYLALRLVPARRSNLRYAAALAALVGVLFSGLVTWNILNRASGADATALTGRPQRSPEAKLDQPPDHRDGLAADAAAPGATEPALAAAGGDRGAGPPPARPGAAEATAGAARWSGWLAVLWLVGVAVMLARAISSVRGAARLRRGGRPLDDPAVAAMAEELRRALHVRRRVRLSVCRQLLSPAVLGAVWPVVLLPPAMLAGMPVEQLRAILAHELAHVRRYDYLAGLVQMLIEALGFFNPAVWWISRQVRIEREACCDAVAVAVTGQPRAVAQALAGWAERMRPRPARAPAAAFAGAAGAGLVDRVRRIAFPGHRPVVKLHWYSLAAMLIIGAVVMVGLSRGTAVAVEAAARLLSPQEWMRRLADVRERYGSPPGGEYGPGDNIRLIGVVRTHDGKPLDHKATELTIRSGRPNWASTKSISIGAGHRFSKDGRFSLSVEFGEIVLHARTPGYAPAFAGPLRAAPGGKIDNVELVLKPGFTGRIKLLGPGDEAIRRAEVKAAYALPGFSISHQGPVKIDGDGVASFEHCAPRPLQVEVRAEGCQFDRRTIQLQPGAVTAWRLRPAVPVTGKVISEETGRPIARAVVKMISRQGFVETNNDPLADHTPILATSDPLGRFRLTTLRSDCEYVLFVAATGYGCAFLRGVRPGGEALEVKLGPELYVRGRIIGPPDRLGKQVKKTIAYCNPLLLKGSTYSRHRPASVTFRDGVGHFEIRDLWPGRLDIRAGDKHVRLELEKPVEDLVIDVSPPAPEQAKGVTRPVVLRLVVPAGAPPPTGTVRVGFTADPAQGQAGRHLYKLLPIVEGQARLDVSPPGRLYFRPEGTLGYWFKEKSNVVVPPGQEAFALDVPCVPAGAIYGQVLEADGGPVGLNAAGNAGISVVTVRKSPALEQPHLSVDVSQQTGGKFIASPLPLGGTYRVVAYRGACYVVGQPVSLDEAAPTHKLELRLVEGVTVGLQVFTPEGKPAAGIPARLSYDTPHSHGFSGSKCSTDRDGRVAFERVNPHAPGHYALRLETRRDYCPVSMKLDPKPGSVTIRLKRGRVVTGTVIDEATGRPVPDAEVYALSAGGRPAGFLEAEAPTDRSGQFRFSTLGAGDYRLGVREVKVLGEYRVTPGGALPVILRVRILPWSRLRPAQ